MRHEGRGQALALWRCCCAHHVGILVFSGRGRFRSFDGGDGSYIGRQHTIALSHCISWEALGRFAKTIARHTSMPLASRLLFWPGNGAFLVALFFFALVGRSSPGANTSCGKS